ncbi:MAG: response regulator transcription factor [Betaproteobacteria bacterium]|nr:response regulator transcription factor [Betaproteobacteria bacterium]
MRIALLEDDKDLADVFARWLADAGHQCHTFLDGKALQRVASRESFDLFMLDWQVPDLSGPEVLTWLRETQRVQAPVLFATARDAEEDIVAALQAGADDYMVKPVRRFELLARITALGRRVAAPEAAEVLEAGAVKLDVAARQATVAGAAVDLTDKEFDVAAFLIRNLGSLLSRGHISENVWGRSADVPTRTVDTHMSRLRKKLAMAPEHGLKLTSVYNFGYRLDRVTDEAAPASPGKA